MSCLAKIKSRLWRRVFIVTVYPFIAVIIAVVFAISAIPVCLRNLYRHGAAQWKRK
jgi:hypothetical protein